MIRGRTGRRSRHPSWPCHRVDGSTGQVKCLQLVRLGGRCSHSDERRGLCCCPVPIACQPVSLCRRQQDWTAPTSAECMFHLVPGGYLNSDPRNYICVFATTIRMQTFSLRRQMLHPKTCDLDLPVVEFDLRSPSSRFSTGRLAAQILQCPLE